MNEHHEPQPAVLEEPRQPLSAEPEVPAIALAGEVSAPTEPDGAASPHAEVGDWRTEAGRKGARRIHELIQHGKLYEEEHGLKRGRQRLRQLIEEGKVYEQEHGLNGGRRTRGVRAARVSGEQLVVSLLQTVLRLARPRYRKEVLQLLQTLETRRN